MTVFIIDDERPALHVLNDLLERSFVDFDSIRSFSSPEFAHHVLSYEQPDLIFLDIHMPVMNGFDLLERLPGLRSTVVFTTAYDQYAIRAIRFAAFDYLLKPINLEDLNNCLQRLERKNKTTKEHRPHNDILYHNLKVTKPGDQKLHIRCKHKTYIVRLDDIISMKADNNYSEIYLTGDTSIYTAKTLKYFEDLLPDDHFIRVHKSELVNGNHIKSVDGNDNLILSNGESISMSRRRRSLVINWLNEHALHIGRRQSNYRPE